MNTPYTKSTKKPFPAPISLRDIAFYEWIRGMNPAAANCISASMLYNKESKLDSADTELATRRLNSSVGQFSSREGWSVESVGSAFFAVQLTCFDSIGLILFT